MKPTLLVLLAVAVLGGPWAAARSQAAPPAAQVKRQAETAVQVRRATQQAVDQFSRQESKLVEEASALKRRLAELTRRLQKARVYLADQQAKVAEYQERLAEVNRIRAELEPLLDQTLERLRQAVAQDLAFEVQPRRERLEALQAKLNDFEAGLAVKTRQCLAALAAEARYGLSVAVNPAEVKIDGRLRRVQVFRLGRLALFALSPDGSRAWQWDRAAGRFVPLEDSLRELRTAAEIAQRQRVVGLVELPVGRAPAAEAQP